MSGHFRSRPSPASSKSRKLFGLAAVFALLAALLYAAVLAAPAGAQRRSQPTRRALAARLLKRDPGRRLGGDTIVGVSNGDLLLGVANRGNFMIALGSGETVVGGNRADQLGAVGKNATINGGPGNDRIHGGPGHDTVNGGAGNDLITDTKGSATINTGSGKNEVLVAGHPGRDRVLCASGSVDRIFADRGDYIAPSCLKAPGSRVVYHQPQPTSPTTARSCGHPAAECVETIGFGSLSGLWSSHELPRADCPPSHPFLVNHRYVPFALFETRGVDPRGDVDYFFTIHYRSSEHLKPGRSIAVGINGGSVTNWSFGRREWHLFLHCTSNISNGYCFQGHCR